MCNQPLPATKRASLYDDEYLPPSRWQREMQRFHCCLCCIQSTGEHTGSALYLKTRCSQGAGFGLSSSAAAERWDPDRFVKQPLVVRPLSLSLQHPSFPSSRQYSFPCLFLGHQLTSTPTCKPLRLSRNLLIKTALLLSDFSLCWRIPAALSLIRSHLLGLWKCSVLVTCFISTTKGFEQQHRGERC